MWAGAAPVAEHARPSEDPDMRQSKERRDDGGTTSDGSEPASGGFARRTFLRSAAVAALLSPTRLFGAACSFPPVDDPNDGPLNKRLDAGWVASLLERGEPLVARGEDLQRIGMPIGGIGAGTVYLSGDGRLWHWDIFNQERLGICSTPAPYAGGNLGPIEGSSYVAPPSAAVGTGSEVGQGFTLRWKRGSDQGAARLDARDWRDVAFVGQYPIGRVTYRDDRAPLAVTLEAFTPFVPLDADRSSCPATIIVITLENTSSDEITGSIDGWLENAACHHSRSMLGTRENVVRSAAGQTAILLRAVPWQPERPDPREEIVVEDWTAEGFAGWTVEGTSFGAGPIDRSAIPAYQGDVGGPTKRVANAHAAAPANDVLGRDACVGSLTRTITIERDFLSLWIGGGSHEGTSFELLRDGEVVRRVSGRNDNRMNQVAIDVRDLASATVTMRIADRERGAWGHVGVGEIRQTDEPDAAASFEGLRDFGTMAIGCEGVGIADLAARVEDGKASLSPATSDRGRAMLAERLHAGIAAPFTLAAGASMTRRFVIGWHFPNLEVQGKGRVGRWYASRWPDAAAVVNELLGSLAETERLVRLWRETFYDRSTLPHWLLDRSFANTSTLATATCQRWQDGRFWAWEGVGCCAGTCTHVWHYAQAMGRIFPELERDQRERVDYGVAFATDTGVIRFRAEHNNTFAIDGQAGTVLRAYREHLMSADDAFLRRIWLRVRRSIEAMIAHDPAEEGIVTGPLHNTLDADWPGVVPWLVNMYQAGLRAGQAMAERVGDTVFAERCKRILASGRRTLPLMTFSRKHGYFIHVFDGPRDGTIGVFEGCHIDQVLGQAWCHQVGLGRITDREQTLAALGAIWKHNYLVDVGPFRSVQKAGRWYAVPGEAGTIMASFPFEKPPAFGGPGAWSAMYFNECMSGFEHQVGAHMIWEGMVLEGLAVVRSVHDRYHPHRRNPYNEVECSDHYARAMASYGAYLAACGWEYDGPAGHVGIAPRVRPDDFSAAFTAAEGWGTMSQQRTAGPAGGTLRCALSVAHGQVKVTTIALEAKGTLRGDVQVTLGSRPIPAAVRPTPLLAEPGRMTVRLDTPVIVRPGERLEIMLS